MSDKDKGSKAICVIGMHRSGTSAIARSVNLLGVYLGRETDMPKPRADNPEGFWERGDLISFHDRLLDHFKMSWDTPLMLPEGWHLSGDVKPFRDELFGLVKRNFGKKELWAWKDPRTSVVFDLWKDVLDELGIEVSCLYALRNPLDVARSLEKRDGFSLDKSFGIWLNYNLSALRSTAEVPRVFVSYDRFLSDWEGELKRCAKGLGMPWPPDEAELRIKMGEFIRPGLRHSASTTDDLRGSGAPRPVMELYELLLEALDGDSSSAPSFSRKVDELSEEFSMYSRFFRYDMARMREIENNKPEKEDGRLSEKEKRMEKILNSWSWRVTAPLRRVHSFISRKNIRLVKSSRSSRMPTFLIIGSMKGGTTALYRYLKQHPEIYTCPIKETRFFAMEGEKLDYSRGEVYQRVWKGTITNIDDYRALFKKVKNEKAIGEASPLYIYSPKAPERIRHYIPDVKLIAILRHPADRAYSHFIHNSQQGFEHAKTFEEALKQDEVKPRWRYKEQGFYHEQLKRYFDLFDRSQIRVYLYEDWNTRPVEVIKDIFRFIGVDDNFTPDMSVRHNVARISKEKMPLREETRKQLIEVYREDILKLQKLIDRDLSGWLE